MPELDLGTIQILQPRTLWRDEARDFTPWLAENAEALSDAIGVPIEIETTEHPIGKFKLDMYGTIEGTDKKVAIENQLDPSDHKHLGQLVTYAAGLDASVVIWVTPNVREEHRDAVDWLNDISGTGTSFFMVRPEVIQIDQSKPAVRFVVEAEPSDFIKTMKEAIGMEESPKNRFRMEFWQAFFDYLAEQGETWASRRKTTKDTMIYTAGGKTGVGANVSMVRGPRIKVEISLDHQEAEVNKQNFEILRQNEALLTQALMPETLSWEDRENKKSCRVAVYRDYDEEKTVKDVQYQKELFAWMMKNLVEMRRLAREVLG